MKKTKINLQIEPKNYEKFHFINFSNLLITIFLISLFSILINISYSLDDFSDDEDYSDPDFYSNSDPRSWDYSQVDWSLVPENQIANIPPENLDYLQLSSSQRMSMNIEQISQNFDLIDNLLQDVDVSRAQEAVKESFGVDVEILGNSRIENGRLASDIGTLSLDYEEYKNGLVEVRPNGEIIFIPQSSYETSSEPQLLRIPRSDNLRLDTLGEDILIDDGLGGFVVVSGSVNFEPPRGNSGNFLPEDSILRNDFAQMYLNPGESAVINDIKIESGQAQTLVGIDGVWYGDTGN